jgi:probable H4MPT-linked C1 transfer pathway protein
VERAVIFGWDLGGAHVKAAVLDADGGLARVAQRPCPLWLGREHLERALAELAGGESSRARHALTMTGELVDLFPDRASGVVAILEAFQGVIDTPDVLVFAGEGFVDARTARANWSSVASANWLATAALVAGLAPDALVLDVGSTTTDVMLIANGRVRARGRDDHGRLAREELVYTGVVRTPVAAIAEAVPFGGEWVGVMAEQFATTADVYRITGELDPRFDQADTADGGARSREASMRRLARMVGCDVEAAPAADWERLARWLSLVQVERIGRACDRALSLGLIGRAAPVVGLGVGHFLAARLAARLDRPYVEFAALAGVPAGERLAVNTCGPAFAVAELRRQMA